MAQKGAIITCPECKGTNLSLVGFIKLSTRKRLREFKCVKCKNKFTE